jgi:hypothetical protein
MMKSGPITKMLIGGTKFSRYSKITAEATINMMVSGGDVGKKGLVDYLGYLTALQILGAVSRGVFFSTRLNNIILIVGRNAYRVQESLTFELFGVLNTSSGDVYITENFNGQIGIVDGNLVYVYDYFNSQFFNPIIDFVPIFITYQDTYMIATGTDGRWRLSGSNNAALWDPLQNQQLQTKADILQAAVVLDRKLFIIGTKATELWYDQGLQLFPYVRDNSLAIDYGAVNRSCIATGFGMLVWFAKNEKSENSIVFTTGGKPQRISTEGLDAKLNNLCKPDDSSAFLFQHDGHIIYQISFNTDNFSFCYDFTENLFYTLTDENLDRHIAKKAVFFAGKMYFISFIDGNLYQMSTNITTYDGKEIPRIRILPPIRNPSDTPFAVKRINLQMEQGHSSDEMIVQMSLAKNGGVCFGNYVNRTMNKVGYRQGIVEFRRLGRAIDLTIQIRFYSKSRYIVTDGSIEFGVM